MGEFVSQFLDEHHCLDGFDCGNEVMNVWLKERARSVQSAGACRSYVWTGPDDLDVLAYFSIAPTEVRRAELPSKRLAGGLSVVPSYLLGRLALDQRLHHRRLGSELLVDALTRIVEAARVGGGRLIVVDAIDEKAHAFYRRHDFVLVGDTSRLCLKVATAEKVLG